MRRRQAGKNGKILTRAKLIAQALRFLRPYFSEPWPERFDEIHLVTMLNDATGADRADVPRVGIGPAIGHQLPRAPICRRQPSVTMSKSMALSGQRSSDSVA